MYKLLLTTLALLTTYTHSVPIPYQLCQNIQLTKNLVTIQSVDANVWPPVAGETLSIKASGMLSEQLDSATYHITVKYDDMVVMNKKGDVKEFIELPLQAQQLITVEKSHEVPSTVPDGDVLVNAVVYDSTNTMILCVDVSATLGPPDHIQQSRTIIPDINSAIYQSHISQYMNNKQISSIEDDGKEIEFQLCGDESDPIQIQSMRASDWPLVPGKPLTLYVTADVTEEIDNGTYEAKVLFDGLQVIDKKDTLANLGLQLPLQKGINKFSKQFDVPKNLPQGDVQLSAIAHNDGGKELMCATIELQV